MTIVYHCITCENNPVWDELSKEYERTTFDYFSDAHKHMMQHPDHWMETLIETDEEE